MNTNLTAGDAEKQEEDTAKNSVKKVTAAIEGNPHPGDRGYLPRW